MSGPLGPQQSDGVGRRLLRCVVGAAIVREGRALAARRRTPADLAGLWEFPGGKVEPGESEPAAVARECREELGISVAVGDRLGCAPISEDTELVLYAATLTNGQPTSSATHDLLRWLTMDELAAVQWLEPDKKLLGAVEQHMSTPGDGVAVRRVDGPEAHEPGSSR